MFRLLLIVIGFMALLAAPAGADQRDPRLDLLFVRLQAADPDDGVRTTEAIRSLWRESAVPGVVDHLGRGMAASAAGRARDAVEAFEAVIALAPEFAEAYAQRAAIYVRAGLLLPAIVDAEKAIRLEPRHFDALAWLGQINLSLGDGKGAENAFAQALAINPHLGDIRATLDELRRARARREL